MTHRTLQIIINGQQVEWNNTKISFKEIVKIVFPQVTDKELVLYTVTYHNWPEENPKGSMSSKDKVDVTNQMVFTCTSTSQS